jgi:hypothetical protein
MFNSILLEIVNSGAAVAAQVTDTAKSVVSQVPMSTAPKQASYGIFVDPNGLFFV